MKNNDLKQRLIEKTKLNIAMSEFGKEYSLKEKITKNRYIFIYKKVVLASFIIFILVIGTVHATKMLNFFKNNRVLFPQSISDAITNGYVENLNMGYVYSDNIGLKINSLLLSETDINLTLDFKLNNKTNLENENFIYDYIIYNENNEIYGYSQGFATKNLLQKFAKENKINDLNIRTSSGNYSFITFTEDNIVTNLMHTASNCYPKTKKLYIKVIGVGCLVERKYQAVSNSEWIFQLDIPDKFYLSENIEYVLKENTEKIEIEKILITDTSTIFIAYIPGINGKGSEIKIIDEFGKEYNAYGGISYTGKNLDRVQINFPINKSMITNKLYLKMNLNNEEKLIELIKK